MANDRLRAALARADLSAEQLAHVVGVDPKTVHRWLSGRVPHPRHRWAIADRVAEDEDFLWPGVRRPGAGAGRAAAEIVSAHGFRSDLDTKQWWDLFVSADQQIDLLGFTLYFLPQQHPGLLDLLNEKAESGCRIRIVIADPTSKHVADRDAEEHQAITISARIQSTLEWLEPLEGTKGIEARFQDVPLYNSVFRFDDEMLVTPHLYATPGHAAPILRLKRLGPNGLFSRFAAHFEGIWADTHPMGEDREHRGVRSGG